MTNLESNDEIMITFYNIINKITVATELTNKSKDYHIAMLSDVFKQLSIAKKFGKSEDNKGQFHITIGNLEQNGNPRVIEKCLDYIRHNEDTPKTIRFNPSPKKEKEEKKVVKF